MNRYILWNVNHNAWVINQHGQLSGERSKACEFTYAEVCNFRVMKEKQNMSLEAIIISRSEFSYLSSSDWEK